MSGGRQHHLPRLLLRGFLVEDRKSQEMVWQYRKGVQVKLCPIGDVAVENNFYSKPSPDGKRTLDDEITEYEKQTLTPMVRDLRNREIGSTIDARIAAEVIAHLAPRTSHVRKTIKMMVAGIAQAADDVFTDADAVAEILALDGLQSYERFRENTLNSVYEHPLASLLSAPKDLVAQYAFWLTRESFGTSFPEQNALFKEAFSKLRGSAKDLARKAHTKALREGIIPKDRVQKLVGYSWTIEGVSGGCLILPDCVAIAYDAFGNFDSYAFSSDDTTKMIVMSVSSEKVLVGRRNDLSLPDAGTLNRHFAESAQDFFVSSSCEEDLYELHSLIGIHVSSRMDDVFDTAKEKFFSDRGLGQNDEPSLAEDAARRPRDIFFSVRLFDYGDDVECEKTGNFLKRITEILVKHLPLSRLDGFTVAYDPSAAIREMDRGFEPSPSASSADEKFIWGKSVPVLRDGIVKTHIVCNAHMLVAVEEQEEETLRRNIGAICHLLGEASALGIIDESMPDFLLKPIGDPYEGNLVAGVSTAYVSYLASHYAFAADDGGAIDQWHQIALKKALLDAEVEIRAARKVCLVDRNFDRLLHVSLENIGHVLSQAANLLGHRDGLGAHSFAWNNDLEAHLISAGLLEWLDLFRRDLGSFWGNVGRWKSPKELLSFNRHVERLLLNYGVFVCRSEDDLLQIFPMPDDFPTEGGWKAIGPWMTGVFYT